MAGRLCQEDLVCANCLVKMRDLDGSVKLLRCGGCKLLHYCSVVCQTEHWHDNHKSVCKIFSRKKKISETKHKEGICNTCLGSYWLAKKNIIVKFYLEKFGYHLDVSDEEKIKEEDYPWQCPYQLGESTGVYLGWVDEYLARIDELLLRKGAKYISLAVEVFLTIKHEKNPYFFYFDRFLKDNE